VYRLRFALLLAELEDPEWVTDAEDGPFRLHQQPFVFGPQELAGLRIFLDRDRGNCVACHPPPAFTDFAMHDTGVTQLAYDRLHGLGSFDALHVPSDAERSADPDRWLPRTPAHPDAAEPFRAVASADAPGRTDLGVWNLLHNPDFADPKLQKKLLRLVCLSRGFSAGCRRRLPTRDAQLAAAVALFKTPSLRDLGQSGPYFHTGDADGLEDVLQHYVRVAQTGGALRNGDPQLRRMRLGPDDVAPLAAFLRALNEDYD
jgi:cytochrome c peroxidase